MTRIAVVDHGAGNLVSMAQGLERAGATPVLAERPADLAGAAGVVLPGVGATGAAMQRLTAGGWIQPLREVETPLLGICVGLQLLFTGSEEDPEPCLGILPGWVRRLSNAPRLPHIGWNDLDLSGADPLFAGLPPSPTFYFVHSFAPVPADPSVITATTIYGDSFCAAVRVGHITGVQFHPERSGGNGLRVLANFVAECGRQPRPWAHRNGLLHSESATRA